MGCCYRGGMEVIKNVWRDRKRLLEQLLEKEYLTETELAVMIKSDISTVSFDIRTLLSYDFVEKETRIKDFYKITPKGEEAVQGWIKKMCEE